MQTTEQRKQIAETILHQLGGKRFALMTGSKNFMFGSNGELRFDIPRNASKANHVHICLDQVTNTYTVKFIRKPTIKEVQKEIVKGNHDFLKPLKVVDMVYCDMLQDVFTNNTGLYTKI